MNAPTPPRTPATASSSSSDPQPDSKDPVLNAPHAPATPDTPEIPETDAHDGVDAAHDDGIEDDDEGDLPEVQGGIGAPPYEGDARCGLIAIVGRPNVGKSTLLNALVGQKVSITSKKAQTTRHRITGVRTVDEAQFVFVDTPGFQTKHSTALNRNLNRTVQGVLADVDLVLFVVEAGKFGLDDAKVLSLLPQDKPVVLIANKLDAVHRRAELMPWLKSMQERRNFTEFVPLSAKKDADVQRLFQILKPYLPNQEWFYEEDALTDRSEKFLAAEMIREKLFRLTGDELPYEATVVIDRWEEEGNLRRIAATIVVERDNQKGMVIGQGGERLKRIGSEARQELETLMEARVFLELWVKVRSGWADSEEHLRSYGYE
ncbi:GTPase Era [Roseateles chitosanitabidus]|jgi:GTP-binding protein Era|uniref:GTPase Era n=1 Tax=Roseateles chitosanitabidus TaxID=65048 RepID=UPI000A063242|nr:GTPase Era [Roseateles chitosanitabidus]MBO9688631.1 GTPase Era [Roseateles chitosanitabidus]